MKNTVFLPGFALNKSMYSRLDVFSESLGIDIVPNSTWNDTLDNISEMISGSIPESSSGSDPCQTLVIGYSMGARLALGLALQSPETVKALVLISCHAGLADINSREERIATDRALASKFTSDLVDAFANFDKNPIFDQQENSEYANVNRIENAHILSNQLDVLGLGKMPNYEERLNELRIPVLYISGSRDKKYTELNARYKKKTPFSHHRVLDSDHRVVQNNPLGISLNIEWFSNNFI